MAHSIPPPWLASLITAEGLPADFAVAVTQVYRPLAGRMAAAARAHGPGFVTGLCGAQGSGKSTVAAVLARLLGDEGLSTAVLSLDDLYLDRAARRRLATEVHPLFAVRGPPGTHDVALGLAVLESLGRAGPTALPRFDKAADQPLPRAAWPIGQGPVDVILFEGWCLGARPQPPEALLAPINALERERDPEGIWRAAVNAALAIDYQPLFARIDHLILLAAPGFEVVCGWRAEQEVRLRARLTAAGRALARTMDPGQVAEFVQYYERLTRHILAEAPGFADTVIRLDPDRRPVVSSLQ
jgi:D-glycerate 3-kinase